LKNSISIVNIKEEKRPYRDNIVDELNRLKAKAEEADEIELDKINKQLLKYKAMFKEKEKAKQKAEVEEKKAQKAREKTEAEEIASSLAIFKAKEKAEQKAETEEKKAQKAKKII
jgi:hypothetical protein